MKKILILASNPKGDLRIDREISDLKKAVERSKNQEQFDVEIELAVSPEDLQDLFHEYKPYIVHFCGHGTGEKGLVFENQAGGEQIVSNQALSSLFKIFRDDVKCVLLNACHTEVQADAIVEHIQYVVGTSREILDQAAYWFAVGFYRGLGYGKLIEQCYELGCNAVELQMPNVTILPSTNDLYRKLEVVDGDESFSEPLKIVLKKNSLLASSPERNNKNNLERSPSNPKSVEIPSDFREAISKEGELKRYKDSTRKTWDEFGQVNGDRPQPLTQQEYRQRKILLNKVKDFWIEGYLKPSLYADTAINLDLKKRPDAVRLPFQAIAELPVELDDSFEELQQTDIFNQTGQGRTLLILGEPGSGKTIALLQLAQRIIEQTEKDLSQPIPVVFNLSSWASRRKPIEEWLIEELREKYQVPKLLSEPWIEQEKLILLLDGLDEVKAEHRNACVLALNKFIVSHGMTEMVICSRVKDYEALTEKLQLSSAICIQPLSSEQVYGFLEKAGDSLTGLKTLLSR
ncbi:MAG: NACHT domain-containing protein [Waterburya sp.]